MLFFVFLLFKKKQEKRTSDKKLRQNMGSRESAQRSCSTHKPMQKIFDSEKAVGKHSHKQYLTTHRTCQKSVTAKFSSEMYGFP